MGDHQGQKLLRLSVDDRDGYDSILGWVKANRKANISPALGIHPIVGVSVRIEKDRRVPAIRRNIGDGIDFIDDVVPKGIQIRSTWENAGHPDDGYISSDVDVMRVSLRVRGTHAHTFTRPCRSSGLSGSG